LAKAKIRAGPTSNNIQERTLIMTLIKTIPNAFRWIGIMLFAIGANAEDVAQTRSRAINTTTTRQPEPSVRVVSAIQEAQTRTVQADGRWVTGKSGTQTKTRTTDWHGELGETTWNGLAKQSTDKKILTEVKTGNIPSTRLLGSTRLKNSETVWEGKIGPEYRRTLRGDLGTTTIKASAGANGAVNWGDNGIEAKGQVGIETELKATTKKMEIGNETMGASLKGSARLEASALAKGRFGAFVDEKGITFAAEGSAGVYVKGDTKLNFEAHVFGVKTNVNLIASGYAGALAEGKAVATLGWNGKVSFMASLGASLGFGGGLAVEFEMDAGELMKRLNFSDLSQLLAWMKAFQENPLPALTQLGVQVLRKVHESGFGIVRKLGKDAIGTFENQVMKPLQATGEKMKEGLGKGIAFLSRLIRAPKTESENDSVDACIQQVADHRPALPEARAMAPSHEFPTCLTGAMNSMTGLEDWEGINLYSWFPFDWPTPYEWPSL
jgi:hypothetical protein